MATSVLHSEYECSGNVQDNSVEWEDNWYLSLISNFLVLSKQIDNDAFIQSLCWKVTVTSSL